MVTGIGGVFFKAPDKDATRAWYSEHLGIADGGYGAIMKWPSLALNALLIRHESWTSGKLLPMHYSIWVGVSQTSKNMMRERQIFRNRWH